MTLGLNFRVNEVLPPTGGDSLGEETREKSSGAGPGIVMAGVVRLRGALPVFLMVKVMLNELPRRRVPKSVPFERSGVSLPETISCLLPSTASCGAGSNSTTTRFSFGKPTTVKVPAACEATELLLASLPREPTALVALVTVPLKGLMPLSSVTASSSSPVPLLHAEHAGRSEDV